MTTLVTGNRGFAGQWLVKALETRGDTVIGYDIVDGQDVCNLPDLQDFIAQHKPDEIYHLAAQASVPNSVKVPQVTLLTNIIGTVNLLEACRVLPNARLLIASTGHAQTQSSPYTISKLAMEYLCQWYAETYNLQLVITRAHNHTGPGQAAEFVVPGFAKQIVAIEQKKQRKLLHGNLDSVRNITDVRDVVQAYLIAMQQSPGVYTICSPHNVKVKTVLDTLIKQAKVPVKHELDKTLWRPTSDFTAVTSTVPGWKAEIAFEQTLEDILNYWREQ